LTFGTPLAIMAFQRKPRKGLFKFEMPPRQSDLKQIDYYELAVKQALWRGGN